VSSVKSFKRRGREEGKHERNFSGKQRSWSVPVAQLFSSPIGEGEKEKKKREELSICDTIKGKETGIKVLNREPQKRRGRGKKRGSRTA